MKRKVKVDKELEATKSLSALVDLAFKRRVNRAKHMLRAVVIAAEEFETVRKQFAELGGTSEYWRRRRRLEDCIERNIELARELLRAK